MFLHIIRPQDFGNERAFVAVWPRVEGPPHSRFHVCLFNAPRIGDIQEKLSRRR